MLKFTNTVIRIVELLLVKPFVLPLKIYKISLDNLSAYHEVDNINNEHILSDDFPTFVYLTELYEALIILTYPLGLIISIYTATKLETNSSYPILFILAFTYFSPIFLSILKELVNITLDIIKYLKNIQIK